MEDKDNVSPTPTLQLPSMHSSPKLEEPRNSPSPLSFRSPALKINPIIEEFSQKPSLGGTKGSLMSNILIKSFQPCLRPTSSDSGEQFKDLQSLLMKYRRESLLLSEIQMMSSEYCRVRNQYCTLCALMISLLCSVVDPILQKYAKDVQKIFTTISFAFIGGLNVVFNFLHFAQREERHKQARDSYLQIIDTIEVALAYSHEENPDKRFDFHKVLAEVRSVKNNIAKNSPAIPAVISHKYESILSPSLLKYELKEEQRVKKQTELPINEPFAESVNVPLN